MTYARHGVNALDYSPCHYPGVETVCRGPKRPLDGPYLTFLGGTAFYGKYVETPIPDQIEAATDIACVNLGQMNGGLDVLSEPGMVALANGGVATVIEVVGAQNLSNQFYRVHPRRNDRVVAPTRLFRQVFPEVDLSEIHFTRHLLSVMEAKAPNRFETVVDELRSCWVEGMEQLLRRLDGPKLLLWVVPVGRSEGQSGAVQDPLFVDRAAVRSVAGLVDEVVEVRETPTVTARGYVGMRLPEIPNGIIEALPRAALLEEAALSLLDPLQNIGVGTGRARMVRDA